MDKKFYDIDNNNDLSDFLSESDTYIEDENTFIVGDKKTGVMFDKRTGKVFNENFGYGVDKEENGNLKKYDFLEYKRSIDILNGSDLILKKDNLNNDKVILEDTVLNKEDEAFMGDSSIKMDEPLENSQKSDVSSKIHVKNKFLLKKYLDRSLKNRAGNNFKKDIPKKEILSEEIDKALNDKEFLRSNFPKNEDDKNKEDFVIDVKNQSDDEILEKINKKFVNSGNEFLENNKSVDLEEQYNFSSFEDERISDEKVEISTIEDVKNNDLDKFKRIFDFEEYLSIMPSEEIILDSPFEDKDCDIPQVVVQEEDEDSFLPFDVEEIQSYDVSNENSLEEGMIPEFNLNQSISKKVSIREVIKSKQKKKQEQKELQKKLFFETLDERIEEFKQFKEETVGSQEILNALNMDLNRINSSIRIEFDNLNRKRKFDSKISGNKNEKRDDKFSLQNLLEEICEENGEKVSTINTDELDIEAVKKDLAAKDNDKKIVN